MFVGTKEAARMTGLSEYELRIGFKEGRYPALEIGRGNRRKSLRWDTDVLMNFLRDRMNAERAAECR